MPQARKPESTSGFYIRYYSNGGTEYDDIEVASFPVTLTEDMLPTPTREGYLFAGWYTTGGFDSGTKVGVGQSLSAYTDGEVTYNYAYLYAKWIQGIPAQIQRISTAVDDIKSAITEKGGTLAETATVDDLADSVRALSVDTTVPAGSHNAIYRGEYLGDSVTDDQWSAIAAGTFEDLYIGDYWTIGGYNYRIAAFDYYYKTGDTSCTTHHVTLVPDSSMYTHAMNDTNVTTDAYVGSKMYTEGLDTAKTAINNAFGSAHILSHRQYLQNATTNGYASAGSWYDSTVELMTEQNVYGCKIFGNCINGTASPNNYTVDKSQYPLFAFRPDMTSNRSGFWFRDVASATSFCYCSTYGTANYATASKTSYGVRPAFSIC